MMSLRRALASAMFAALTVGFASRASAQEASSEPPKTAQELFGEALTLLDAGDRPGACAKFRESLALEPSIGTLLNVGECDATDGRPLDAIEKYRHAKELNERAEDGARKIAVDAQISSAMAMLGAQIGKLRVVVEPPSAAAEMQLLSRPGAKAEPGVAIELAAGEETVTVEAPGFERWTGKAKVAGGAEAELRVVLVPLGQKEPPPGGDETSGALVAGIVLGSAGVVGLAIGGALVGMAAGVASDLEAECEPAAPPLCGGGDVDRANDLAADGEALATGSYVAFAIGGALAATGLVLVIVGASSAEPTASPAVTLSPFFGGVAVQGAY